MAVTVRAQSHLNSEAAAQADTRRRLSLVARTFVGCLVLLDGRLLRRLPNGAPHKPHKSHFISSFLPLACCDRVRLVPVLNVPAVWSATSRTRAQADNRFMVSGGYDPQGVPSRKVEAYNPVTFQWDGLADLPHAARDHKMCAVPGASLPLQHTVPPALPPPPPI
mgnify:CR=1 FL=1|jgi:hypothetical protein